jgi:hypothetical protein
MTNLTSDPTGEVELSSQDPWPGLAAFSEESTHLFKGRERESEEVSRLIRREFLCVLFGKSGTGKSSLLRAGVFPLLRPLGFYPVYIRLLHEESEPPLSDQVKQALSAAIRAAGGEIEAPEPKDAQTLWQYFYAIDTDWWDHKSHIITPVLVFDQFEEILTLGRETDARVKRADVFLSDLEDLIEGRVPDDLQKRREADPSWRAQFDEAYNPMKRDLRIVLTLREDFLADLESLRERLKPVMLNRYRLLPMTGSQALQVILEPAPGLVNESVALQIIQRVSVSERSTLQAKPTKEQIVNRSVEPALLSVFCSELNLRRKAKGLPEIDESLLEGAREEILSDFYERSFRGLPQSVRDFAEDKLLTVTGARDRCEISNALAYDSITVPTIRTLINRRLIRKETLGSSVWIELTHDTIADVARASKRSRQERARIEAAETELRLAKEEAMRRNRQRKRALLFAAAAFMLCLAAVGLAINAWRVNRKYIKANGALKQMEERRETLQKTMVVLQNEQTTLKKANEGLIGAAEINLDAYIALAQASLLDPYPRSDPLLSGSDVRSVREEFAAIKVGSAANVTERINKEFRLSAEAALLAIIDNDLDGAAQACERAISEGSTLEAEARSRLLRLKGDILIRQVSVDWYGDQSLQQNGPAEPKAKDLQAKVDNALATYQSAFPLTNDNTGQEVILLTREARALIWRSRLDSQGADDEENAARLIDQASSRLKRPDGQNKPSANLCIAQIEVFRMRGFLSVRKGDNQAAAGFYEQSIAAASQGAAEQANERLSRTGIVAEKLLALVRVANCYEELIKASLAGDTSLDLNDYKGRLTDVLEKRIDLAREILTRYRSSRYVMQILGFSFYDQARCHFQYALLGLNDEDAYDALRQGFLLTLSDNTDRGKNLRNYFEEVISKKWGNPEVGKALTDEMRKAMPKLQSLFQEPKQSN